jgi:hypothetical protein
MPVNVHGHYASVDISKEDSVRIQRLPNIVYTQQFSAGVESRVNPTEPVDEDEPKTPRTLYQNVLRQSGDFVGKTVRELACKENLALLLAVQKGKVKEAQRLIQEKAADVNVLIPWQDGSTPLHFACKLFNIRVSAPLVAGVPN